MKYIVGAWASHPEKGNDDCIVGQEFDTLTEAEREFQLFVNCEISFDRYPNPAYYSIHCFNPDFELLKVKKNPAYVHESTPQDSEWRREMQMEDAMLHGIEGYNAWEGC